MTVLPAALRRVCTAASLCLATATAPAALAAEYDLPPPGSDVIGKVQHIHTQASDTFVSLARAYDVGYDQLQEANPHVDPWLPGQGTPLTIPTAYVLPDAPRRGIVINVPEMRLYYYPPPGSADAGKVFTFPIGVGREGWATPVAETHVIQKIPHPSWTPTASIRAEHAKHGDPLPNVVPAGPDNPLGQYALRLALPDYLIHGTNKPAGVGMHVSHGCIRLFADDIQKLFSMARVGTPVDIVSQPYKVGWQGNELVMEAHPPNGGGNEEISSYTPWVQALIAGTNNRPHTPVDWTIAEAVAQQGAGIPEPIGGEDFHPSASEDKATGVPAGTTATPEGGPAAEQTGSANPYDPG